MKDISEKSVSVKMTHMREVIGDKQNIKIYLHSNKSLKYFYVNKKQKKGNI